MFTYKATNTLNGRFYIGSAKDFEKRKRQHLASRSNYPFQNSLRNNPEAFEWEVFEDEAESPILEQALLDQWFGTEMCYNLNKYACGGSSGHSEDTKQKMCLAQIGKPKSDPHREAISKGRQGMRFSESHRENISKSKTGTSHDSWNKGKSWFYNMSTHETRMFSEDPGTGWKRGRKA